jgi:cation diffusion facilitator CzcD-associated flavoprotein CzcO
MVLILIALAYKFLDDYFPLFAMDHVRLDTGKIQRITPSGIEVDGKETEYDLIVCATGFQTTTFFQGSLDIKGSAGRSLDDIWKNGPRALYGMAAESLPNFAMLYGPNSNLGHNSSEFFT